LTVQVPPPAQAGTAALKAHVVVVPSATADCVAVHAVFALLSAQVPTAVLGTDEQSAARGRCEHASVWPSGRTIAQFSRLVVFGCARTDCTDVRQKTDRLALDLVRTDVRAGCRGAVRRVLLHVATGAGDVERAPFEGSAV
jgi:hypothetical protein